MTLSRALEWSQWFFLGYFIFMNLGYALLNLVAYVSLRDYSTRRWARALHRSFSGVEPPVSLLVPAFNESATVAGSVRSILQLDYPDYEVIVINDGSSDDTLEVLRKEFRLVPYPEPLRQQVPHKPLRGVYRSAEHPNLKVIDKDNGGKADALNAGINVAHFPLLCAIDADSILQRDSLWKVVEPFMEDPRTIAAGGTVRVANGCVVDGGFLTRVGLPDSLLARFQIVEYLRAFLFGRMGWSPLNAVLVISGAFGLFRRSAVVEAGGYRSDTVGEDMELVVRLHRLFRERGEPYRIVFVPEPICWTEVPESLPNLRNQRIRWHRGLSESLAMNLRLLFHRRGGAAGWLAMPFMVIIEWLSPLIELAGYTFMIVGWMLGLVSFTALWAFLLVAVMFGMMLSVSAMLLEELEFRIYPRGTQLLSLLGIAIVENFGYRQLMSWFRLIGMVRWATGQKGSWGTMVRTGSWQKKV